MESKKNRVIRHFASSPLATDIDAFLVDREARNLSPRTLEYYDEQLTCWLRWSFDQGIATLDHVSAKSLREWLNHLLLSRSPGGVAANYRALRAFLLWVWQEDEMPGRNPIAQVRPPKVALDPLEPIPMETLQAILDTCSKHNLSDQRDRAMLLALLDTGCRASEFVALNIGDLDLSSGMVRVRHGKGGKQRTVFVGNTCKRELVRYFRYFDSSSADTPLWITVFGSRLSYEGLRMVLRRRAAMAGVEAPTLHAFRRAFALMSLRNGVDVYSLQRMMGHADLAVLRRYLAQTQVDIQKAHNETGPVDHGL